MIQVQIHDHKSIVPHCDGCDHVIYSPITKKKICACYTNPEIKWWPGCVCDQATHFHQKPSEDPVKEP